MRGVILPADMKLDEGRMKLDESSAFGRRWLVENIAADNTNHLWNAIYGKVINLVKQRKGTGDIETRAHYDYLLYLINRSLKKAPKW